MRRIRDVIKDFLNKDRFEIFGSILVVLLVILLLRLFYLTGIRGNYYREISENKRAKDIVLTAPRGEIRDRSGALIAGNRPVFTVQLRKDEIDSLKKEDKNKSFLKLVRYLEEDGVNYMDDFPIALNVLRYASQSDYLSTDVTPRDTLVSIIQENGLLSELLDTFYEDVDKSDHYVFYTVNRFLNGMGVVGESVPIKVYIQNNQLMYEYKGGDEAAHWKNSHGISSEATPKEAILYLASDNDTYIKKLLEHPIARKLAFQLVEKKELSGNLKLEDYFNDYYDKYFETKIKWMKLYPEINMDSSAEEDFYILFEKNSLESLLLAPVDETTEDVIFPGKLLAEIVEKQENSEKVMAFLEKGQPKYKFEDGTDAWTYLLGQAKDRKILKEWIHVKGMKSAAQNAMIEDGINSGISVAGDGFEYVDLKNMRDWEKKHEIKENTNPQDAFKHLCERYEISEDIGIYEARGILNIYNEVSKQGNLAYIPINFAYKIKNETVAKISENISPNTGISVSSEPIRYYPLGNSCSHILGYLGKISSDSEVSDYIDKKGYERNALVGKTGIEHNYEDYLYGKNGKQRVEVDSVGNTTKVLSEIKPKPGNNVYLSIDLDLQQKTEQTLEKSLALIREGGVYESQWGSFPFLSSTDKSRPYKNATSGAVMVVDVKTGKILTMASFPGYDPNLFSTGISTSDWESLLPKEEKDPLAPRPLYNIPLQTAVQPGSTFKMITGLTALEKGMSPDQVIGDGGWVDADGGVFGCWLWNQKKESHGDETLYTAIRDSCNYYFYSLALGENQRSGKKLPVKISAEEIAETSEKFGLGEKTGIEIKIPSEAKGNVPRPKQKTQTMKQLLKYYLDAHLEEFYEGEAELTDKKKDDIITDILTLFDGSEVPERQVVVEKLKINYISIEKTAEGAPYGLVDMILSNYLKQGHWNMADTLNVTIGQGSNSYTIAQMTRYVMALVNGGNLHQLSLVENIMDEENNHVILERQVEGSKIELNDYKHLDALKEGMHLVSKSGIEKRAYEDFPIEVGVKTGTAERAGANPYTGDTYDSFSWQVGFAPYDNPEIAVACVLIQGGPGSNSSPIIREVFAEYFGLNKEVQKGPLPIETTIKP